VPAAHGILIDQIEQLDAIIAHHTRGGVGIRTTFIQGHKVVVTVLRPGLIPQNPRRDGKLAMAGQGTEVQGTIAVRTNRRQGHAEDTLLAPLEVNSSHIEVTPQGIREEVRVGRESPGLVQLPGVGNQTIAQLIGEIGIGIIAILANILVSQPGQHLTLTWLENSKVKKAKQRWGSRDREPKAWSWGDNFTCCLLPLTQ